MGLKYYVPDNYKNLAGCEGFYIENKNFLKGENWESAVTALATKLKRFIPRMKIVNDWRSEMGVSRYILLKDDHVQIITGDDERYFSIFVIIPESVTATERAKRDYEQVCGTVRSYLLKTYGEIFRRKNTWNLEPIVDKRRRAI